MYIISVILDKDKVKGAVYSNEYKQIAVCEKVCRENATVSAAELCKALMSNNSITADNVKYIGAAVNDELGCRGCVAAEIEKLTGIKTATESIINAKALGEAYLSGDESSIVLLKIDDTVESAVVIDKKIYTGSNGTSGKVAHMVINYGGYECSCGLKGCFEAYAGNAGLKRIAAESGVKNTESVTITELYSMNDTATENAKKTYTEILANAITSIINLFQTHELVLEGELVKIGDPLIKPMTEIILRDQYTKLSPIKCNVRVANTKADTALIGAALILR